jgi:hypothetical protein
LYCLSEPFDTVGFSEVDAGHARTVNLVECTYGAIGGASEADEVEVLVCPWWASRVPYLNSYKPLCNRTGRKVKSRRVSRGREGAEWFNRSFTTEAVPHFHTQPAGHTMAREYPRVLQCLGGAAPRTLRRHVEEGDCCVAF